MIFCDQKLERFVQESISNIKDLFKKNSIGRMIFISMTGNATQEKKLLSVDEVCSYLGLGATKVREMLHSPTSTFTVRVGRRVMANKAMLDEYIDKAAKFQLRI